MAENVRVMLSEEDVTKRIRELGAEISKDYEGEELVVVGILSSAQSWRRELRFRYIWTSWQLVPMEAALYLQVM